MISPDNEFKLRFDSNKHEIDASTLIVTLSNISTIIQEINKEFNSDRNLEIRIKTFEQGSFQIDVELVHSFIIGSVPLFAAEYAKHIPTIIKTLVDLTHLHKFLKGTKGKEKIEEDGKVKVERPDGHQMIIHNSGVLNFYNGNTSIPQAFAQTFGKLNNNPAINGFEVRDSANNPLVTVDRECFEVLSHLTFEQESEETNIVFDNKAHLSVTKISFEATARTRWDFKYKGQKISATISDNTFLQKVKEGLQRFGNGDMLEVDLEIQQVYEPSVNSFINKVYTVAKVHTHIPRVDQQSIAFS